MFAAVAGVLRGIKSLISFVGAIVLLVMSSIAIYGDVVYFAFGHEVEATITKVEPHAKNTRIEYQFKQPDGTPRTGSDTAGTDWVTPATGTVKVQYIAGSDGRTRLSRYVVHWLPYVVFVFSIGMLSLTIILGVRRVTRGTVIAG